MSENKILISLPHPSSALEEVITSVSTCIPQITNKVKSLLHSIFSFSLLHRFSRPQTFANTGIRSANRFSFLPKNKKFLLLAILLLVALILLAKSISSPTSSSQAKLDVSPATASLNINKEYIFPLKNSSGEEISKLKFYVENAELRDQIVVKGQRATAVKGRQFLIINLKITNDFDKSLEIDTRDYVRLSVNDNQQEWIAPDIHNDPVEVQAQATKLTRIGFPLNESDTNLKIRVGEINGSKETLEIKFN